MVLFLLSQRATLSAPVHTGPGERNRYRVFPGIKRPGRGVENPLPSSAEVKERVEVPLLPSAASWSVLGRPLPLPLLLVHAVCQYTVAVDCTTELTLSYEEHLI
jgi:hypothetical protein